MSSDPSNEELLARYARSDFSGFDQFYQRHHRMIFSFLLTRLGHRADAEEAFQEAFLRIHKAILRYDPQQSALAWVFTIARNTAVDVARRRRKHPIGVVGTESGIDSRAETALIAREELTRLLVALTPSERSLIESRLVEDETFDAIAAGRGISAAAARQQLSRLLRRLKSGST